MCTEKLLVITTQKHVHNLPPMSVWTVTGGDFSEHAVVQATTLTV